MRGSRARADRGSAACTRTTCGRSPAPTSIRCTCAARRSRACSKPCITIPCRNGCSAGGRLNACYNCVDRHVEKRGDQTAIIWAADEPGVYKHISYRELKHNVCRLANVLLAHGVKKGDRVCIYTPMIPETAYAMLACARIGAVHSVVFGGVSADSLRDRILHARCKVLITADEGMRGGKAVPLQG